MGGGGIGDPENGGCPFIAPLNHKNEGGEIPSEQDTAIYMGFDQYSWPRHDHGQLFPFGNTYESSLWVSRMVPPCSWDQLNQPPTYSRCPMGQGLRTPKVLGYELRST